MRRCEWGQTSALNARVLGPELSKASDDTSREGTRWLLYIDLQIISSPGMPAGTVPISVPLGYEYSAATSLVLLSAMNRVLS